uniref:Uncharacterized protein n=1 Tax=Chromera velia CCMP2878 TaxID=1169474 RepID=A0A0G4HBJ9_9ALVE|eukprot:Cvel_25963.t1-p1 / transcript=Cvel_25963.t1 / gene=Cvel_25963 / organism=Chromera_velia_CCMP2878 / gene_product=hypothetical protein / transcript_product=hypothetical protein / location=Cvel_scaffold3011:10372-10617(+) / protein_length=82 / sequence_SO=supercontig / SO=protein_coding / is_pseudo=false
MEDVQLPPQVPHGVVEFPCGLFEVLEVLCGAADVVKVRLLSPNILQSGLCLHDAPHEGNPASSESPPPIAEKKKECLEQHIF